MKADSNLLVTVSNRNNEGKWQVFATDWSEGHVYGVRDFHDRKAAERHAECVANRLSCRIEFKSFTPNDGG